jgi:hypothetical protein
MLSVACKTYAECRYAECHDPSWTSSLSRLYKGPVSLPCFASLLMSVAAALLGVKVIY